MFKAYVKTICHVIYEAMQDENYDILRGLQSFDLSPWIGLRGVQAIISVIVDLAIASNPFKYGFKERYGEEDKELGIYDRIKERFDLEKEGKITYLTLRHALGGISKKRWRLMKLAELGLIKIEPSGVITDESIIYLTKLWNPFIEMIIKDEIEIKVFVGSLGKMIALGIEEKGIRFLKPIIRGLNRASENEHFEIPFEDFFELYIESGLAYYYLPLFIKSDETKRDDIKLIAYYDKEKIAFNRHSIRAMERWRDAARIYLRERIEERRRF